MRERSGRTERRALLQYSIDPDGLAVRGARRNGIDRLSLSGNLDASTLQVLERDLVCVAHVGGAIILDFRNLVSIDASGLRSVEWASRRAGVGAWKLSIVNVRGHVREAFEGAGIGHLLGGADLCDLLDSGDGEWIPFALSPFLRQRVTDPRQVAREAP
jgi:anti-anti-sigma regulatory factor